MPDTKTLDQLRDELDAATAARARKDEELDRQRNLLDDLLIQVERLTAAVAEIESERDELVTAEDAIYDAFTAAGGRLDFGGYETRYWEPETDWGW